MCLVIKCPKICYLYYILVSNYSTMRLSKKLICMYLFFLFLPYDVLMYVEVVF